MNGSRRLLPTLKQIFVHLRQLGMRLRDSTEWHSPSNKFFGIAIHYRVRLVHHLRISVGMQVVRLLMTLRPLIRLFFPYTIGNSFQLRLANEYDGYDS